MQAVSFEHELNSNIPNPGGAAALESVQCRKICSTDCELSRRITHVYQQRSGWSDCYIVHLDFMNIILFDTGSSLVQKFSSFGKRTSVSDFRPYHKVKMKQQIVRDKFPYTPNQGVRLNSALLISDKRAFQGDGWYAVAVIDGFKCWSFVFPKQPLSAVARGFRSLETDSQKNRQKRKMKCLINDSDIGTVSTILLCDNFLSRAF